MAHLESGHFAFILAHELSSSNAGSSIMCNGGFVFHSSRYSFMNACSGPLPRKSKPAEVNGVSSIWLNTSGVVQVISRYKTPGKPFVLRFTLILTPRRPALRNRSDNCVGSTDIGISMLHGFGTGGCCLQTCTQKLLVRIKSRMFSFILVRCPLSARTQ